MGLGKSVLGEITMKNNFFGSVCAAIVLASVTTVFGADQALRVRIKDIARIAGPEPVELIGYGLVIGLNGTGDKDLEVTKQTVANFLENFNISLPITDVKSQNSAVVIVTATIPAFHSAGDQVDVMVSSIGDASSLRGGQLLMTQLVAPDGTVYALAQGSVTVGGYHVGGAGLGGATVAKNVPTSGIIPNGGLLRYGRSGELHRNGIMTIVLNQADFTTAERTARAISRYLNCVAIPRDANNIFVQIPENILDMNQVPRFIANIESIMVSPDVKAKIVVNERTGTIVMGGDVRIAPAVIAHGNLTVSVKSTARVSQPAPFSPRGETVVTEDQVVRMDEEEAKILAIDQAITVRDLATMLNTLGASTDDLISILEALSRVGALQMKIVTM